MGMGTWNTADGNISINGAKPASTEDPSWPYSLDESDSLIRWNQVYPYQLIMVKIDKENPSGGGYTRVGIKKGGFATFTLPIPPQDLSVSMPFAITTSATLGGIVEEHNGAPFRNISFSGTTGVFPQRATGDSVKDPSSIGTIFAGTLSAVDRTIGAFSALLSNGPKNDNVHFNTDFYNKDFGALTGYYQFRLLQRFLESYARLKKVAAGKDVRLAFAIWKDQAIYLVTPMQFDVRRSAASPMEYTYSLSLKAWRRIKLDASAGAYEKAGPSLRDPSLMSTALNKLQQARQVVQNAQDVIQAVGGDINGSLLQPLREVVYFAKDVLGIAVAVADLPTNVVRDLKATCTEAMTLKNIDKKIADYYQRTGQTISDDIAAIKALGNDSSKDSTAGGDLGHTQQVLAGASPGVKIFEVLEQPEHFDLFSCILPGDLNVSRAVQRKIDAETLRIRSLTRLDFERMCDTVQEFATTFADAVGAGDATYNANFNITGVTTTRTPTPDEWDCIFAMNDAGMELNRLAASGNINKGTVSTMDYIAGLARASGIAFKVPTSKYAIPMPYGSTLEMLALRYLDDPQRWMEIATLNGLQSPYVDEEGFDLDLTLNGHDHRLYVADTSNLYVGQQVWISSNNATRTKRRIVRIEHITNDWTVTVDGDGDLDRFTTIAQAYLHAFLPGTCNSKQLIYIPSDQPAGEIDDKLKAIPGIDEFDALVQVSGIDLLLNSSGDLIMTPDGDCQLAVGLNNIIQKIRIALGTKQGSLIHFPTFGLPVELGVSVADFDAGTVKQALNDLLKSDPTFTGISGVKVALNGPTLQIEFGVQVAGVDQLVPVSFTVRR